MALRHVTPAHPLPPPAGEPTGGAAPADGEAGAKPRQGLVPAPPAPDEDEDVVLSTPVARLPVELDVMVPIREFRVRNLLALAPGHVIASQWRNGEDVPLRSGDVQLAWSEFEVVDTQLAVRVTRLA
jgi:flagellar motor switch protein FliM